MPDQKAQKPLKGNIQAQNKDESPEDTVIVSSHQADDDEPILRPSMPGDDPEATILSAQTTGADPRSRSLDPVAKSTTRAGSDTIGDKEATTFDVGSLPATQKTTPLNPDIEMTGERPPAAPDVEGQATDAAAADSTTKGPGKPSKQRTLKAGYVLHQRYQVLEILGKGGFGAVYLAQDTKLERFCVIKQMIARYWSSKTLKALRANFEREARLLVQLNEPGHPNIPEIYDYFFDDDGYYLVMKYIEGRDLNTVLKESGGSLPLEETLRYAVDLCSALHYMHTFRQEPVIHRDIKPGNILLGNDGRIWLVDFGLAKAQPLDDVADTSSQTQSSGSLGYSPLEQWFGEPTPASDIYAFGATLHHLLSGISPADAFEDKVNVLKLQQRHGQFVPLRRINPQIPEIVEGLVAGATGADPEQRPTALQLYEQLHIFITGAKDAPLFTFKNGQSAADRGRLVDLCDRYKKEAQGYLYRGEFARWFRLLNRNDMAAAAVQAVKRGRTQRDGLEKFLKLIFPNLFLRRLGRAARQVAVFFLQFGLSTLLVLFLTALAASWLGGVFLERAIGDYEVWRDYVEPWADDYTEAKLNNIAKTSTGPLFDDLFIDVQPPHQLEINFNWNGVALSLTLDQVRTERPYHFQLTALNDLSLAYLPYIPDNISRGLNAGLDEALCQAGLEIAALEMKTEPIDEDLVVDKIYLDRSPVACTTTTTTSSPSSVITPSPSPERVETVRLDVVNESGRAIIIKLTGPVLTQTTVAANDRQVIEVSPGEYTYEISRKGDAQTAIIRDNITLTAYDRLRIRD